MGVRVASGDRDVPRDLVFPHIGEIDNVDNQVVPESVAVEDSEKENEEPDHLVPN